MSALATMIATGVSLVAIGRLAAADPKRRRAFRLPPAGRRRPGLAWTAALLPGVLLPFWSGAGGFFVWLGAVTVAGWVVAAVSPDRRLALRAQAGALLDRLAAALAPARAALRRAAGRLRRATSGAAAGFARPSTPGYAELERRLRELEAEVAALRAAAGAGAPPPGATVIELAGRR
ncbi:hypothetical protein [Amaricoccus sp.]|uniref:hypothetical protein n=1 Tax=Amaricoccus sp. TaxID=1872485 RepID=UPI001B69DA4B|nr:hypothetical protein [Amaricoccus sp.]MBP7001367.1 hypothetical protein [Amaricoccus sp.]